MAKQLPSNLAAVRGSSLWYWKIDGTADVIKRDLTLYKYFKTSRKGQGNKGGERRMKMAKVLAPSAMGKHTQNGFVPGFSVLITK